MSGAPPPTRRRTLVLLGALVALQGAALVHEAARAGPAADEPRHLGTGTWVLARGVCCIGYHDTPSTALASWAFLGGRDPGVALPSKAPSSHELGARVLEAHPDAARRLLAGRLTNLPFAAALTIALFALGRRVAGDAGGLAAAAAGALDPSLLGHGHLISPDFLAAALLPVAALAGVRLVERPGPGRGAALGLALGLLLLAKYSTLLPAAVIVVVAATAAATAGSPSDGGVAARARARAGPLLVALAVAAAVLLAAFRVPAVPFFYPIGLRFTRKLVAGGYPSFLLGEYGRGWLSYFAVAVATKVPLPTLGAAALGAAVLLRRRALPPAVAFLLLPAAALFATASITRFDIGIRHVLPVVPALALLEAAALAPLTPRLAALAAAALAACLLPSLPGGVAYGNGVARLAGGIDAVLSDSNVDWGEDVPRLVDWRRSHPEGTLVAAVFAPMRLSWYGLDALELPGTTVNAPVPPDPLPADARWFALSVLNLQGTMLRDRDRYAAFGSRTPVADLGGTIRVFDLEGDPEARALLEGIRRRSR